MTDTKDTNHAFDLGYRDALAGIGPITPLPNDNGERDAYEAGRRHARPELAQRRQPGESPFVTHNLKTIGQHATARRLRRIVLNLYRGGRWKLENDELASYLANADSAHLDALLEMLKHYARHGENDPHFLALGKELTIDALRDEDYGTGYNEARRGLWPRRAEDIPNGYTSDYADGYTDGERDALQRDRD